MDAQLDLTPRLIGSGIFQDLIMKLLWVLQLAAAAITSVASPSSHHTSD